MLGLQVWHGEGPQDLPGVKDFCPTPFDYISTDLDYTSLGKDYNLLKWSGLKAYTT